MKKCYLLFFLFLSAIVLGQNLKITGVVDADLRGGQPKAIELYVENDIADLSLYGLGSANNGKPSRGVEFNFPAGSSAKAGSFIYVANKAKEFKTFFGFDADYIESRASGINGDDAVELFFNNKVIDVFGVVGVNGDNEPWDYTDGWAYRKDGVVANNGKFNADNWTYSGRKGLDGQTSNATATKPFPAKSFGSALLLTGIIDGPLRGGKPKAIEIYVKKDVADLSKYGVGSANNGGGSDGEEFTFPKGATATAGSYIYIATETEGFTAFFGFAPNYTTRAVSVNGDDAVELFFNNKVIDVFGDINKKGGDWNYRDGWAYRKKGTNANGGSFILNNWNYSGKDVLDGATTNATASNPFPLKSYTNGGGDPNNPTIISIQKAREASLGETVTVTGVLTVSDQFKGAAFIQDATGGIAIFDKLVHGNGAFKIGDSITVKAKRAAFKNQIQLSGVISVENNGRPKKPIQPAIITLNELQNHAGQLVKVKNVRFPKPNDMLFGNSNYTLTDASGKGQLRIDLDVAEIVGLAQTETCSEVIGVVGRFKNTYQLLPRQGSDLPCTTKYKPTSTPYDDISKNKTLEVATWNIEWFGDNNKSPAAGQPNSDQIQKDSVKAILQKLDADVIAVQEIVDVPLFESLINELPDYKYILSDAVSYPNDSSDNRKQRVGFIYKPSTINIKKTEVLLKSIHPYYNGGDASAIQDFPIANKTRFFASGRLPFLMTADVTIDGQTEEYNFVALHARANNMRDAKNRYNMRKYDIEVLKDSLDTKFANANLMLIGDYNDDVDETVVADLISKKTSTYDVFVKDKANYTIASEMLSLNGFRSFVFFENMVDHITISNELTDNYLKGSERVHYEYYSNKFSRTASDHFPVSIRLQLKPLSLYTTVVNTTCSESDNGTATTSVSGGFMPYTYKWSNGDTTATVGGLSAGNYNLLVTDAAGNVISEEIIIQEPISMEATTTEKARVYVGFSEKACTDIAVVNVVGGVAPYNYEWNTGETTRSINVCPKETTTYTVTITDANGCKMVKEIVVEAVNVACGDNFLFKNVQICFNGKTLCVPEFFASWYVKYGGILGSCDAANIPLVTELNVYPNPFETNLNVKIATNKKSNVALELYEVSSGDKVFSTEELLNGEDKEQTFTYNLSELHWGLYILKTRIDGKLQRIKAVIKK